MAGFYLKFIFVLNHRLSLRFSGQTTPFSQPYAQILWVTLPGIRDGFKISVLLVLD
jgi:hypothetical protein